VELTDADLVARIIVDDDQHAFGELVRRHQSSVRGLLRQLTRNDFALADDLSQEAFVRAYQSIATFRGDGPFGAWVRRIAIRIAVARLAAGQTSVSLDDGRRHEPDAAGTGRDPIDGLLDAEERATLIDAVSRLPADQRHVITLRFFGDHSVEEIARLTDRPVGTVKSRLSRGVASLRDQFGARSAP